MSKLILCSYGEIFDKISILEIKKQRINNTEKLIEINKEYNHLCNDLNIDIVNNFYYIILKNINEKIWIEQDIVRNMLNNKLLNKNLLELCLKIMTDYNDRRYRIKSKINNIYDSSIKEQKGYLKTVAFHIGDMGLGDHIHQIGAVRYLSTLYDEVFVACKKNNENNLKDIYIDDSSIKLYIIDNEQDLIPKYGCNIEKFKKITKNTTVYMTGCNIEGGGGGPYNYIAVKPYEYLNFDFSIFWEYFHIPIKKESFILFENVKHIKYIFVHDTAAQCLNNNIMFTLTNVNEFLLINPCRNMYNKNDKYFDLADLFVNKPILHYIDTIKNAELLILSDSSFFALAINLEIKTNKCFYVSRYHYYNHIWSDKYIYNSEKVNRKKFYLLHKPQISNIILDINSIININII